MLYRLYRHTGSKVSIRAKVTSSRKVSEISVADVGGTIILNREFADKPVEEYLRQQAYTHAPTHADRRTGRKHIAAAAYPVGHQSHKNTRVCVLLIQLFAATRNKLFVCL